MKISAIVAKDISKKTILAIEGIEESDTRIQMIVPRNVFTENEIKEFKEDELVFNPAQWDYNPESNNVNLGETTAYNITCELEKLEIEIIQLDVSMYNLKSTMYNKDNEVAVLVVYHNETNELLFAEGTDSDGYRYHQVMFEGELDCVDSNDSLFDLLGKEIEAKDVCGVYKQVTVAIKYVLVENEQLF